MGGDPQLGAGVRPGDILAGKYQVDRVIGAGGMGMVVAARHIQLETVVAIKFLLPAMLTNTDAVARFEREARAASRITSEHVARVFDVDTLDDGGPYIVMELLEGSDLLAWLGERGPLPVDMAVDFVLQACVAVADAHALGIVHRDLKPANLFCTQRSDGQCIIKVLDFGISKLYGSVAPTVSVTQTATVMGSPLYMSPEQMRSAKDLDGRTDIWALGVVIFQLLTNTLPFSGQTLPEVAIKVSTEAPPSLRSRCAGVPAGLEAVVFKCLEKDPRGRYSNVGELAVALLPFAPKRAATTVERILATVRRGGLSNGSSPSPAVTQTLASLAGDVRTDAPWSRPPRSSGSRRGVAAIAAAVGAMIVAGGLGAWRLLPASDRHGAAATESGPPRATIASDPAPSATDRVIPAETAVLVPAPQVAELPPAPSGIRPLSSIRAIPPSYSPPPSTMKRKEPAPTLPPRPDCDPPYTLDDQGQKHFKHECYQ